VRRPPPVPASHLLVALLCVGLALPLAVRADSAFLSVTAVVLAVSAVLLRAWRTALLAGAVLLTGWWLGSLRLEALDRSPLAHEIGRVSSARLVVTGPARSSPFDVRVPVLVVRFGAATLGERARLDLPRGRAPPQGAVIEAVVEVRRPRGREPDGFDESSYLRRQGIHVVLSAHDYHVVGRRGGIGGASDSLRAFVSRGLAPGIAGERRAVIAGIILGEDEGIAPQLRDSFRASGLYHLLRKSTKGGTAGVVLRRATRDGAGRRTYAESRYRLHQEWSDRLELGESRPGLVGGDSDGLRGQGTKWFRRKTRVSGAWST
jgi:hypothetical protein